MTWTILYVDNNNKLSQRVVDAPHGGATALEHISKEIDEEVLGIIAGNHCFFFSDKFSKTKLDD